MIDVDKAIGHAGEVLTEAQKSRGLLIHAFQQIQKEHNYLPEDELTRLSKTLNIPLSIVYSTASFYKHFYFNKRKGLLGLLLPSNVISTFSLLFLTFYLALKALHAS